MRKKERSTSDKVFGILLWICLAAIIVSLISWALGWEDGALVAVFFGALANVPMFHFAMNWPLRDSKNSEEDEAE